MVDDRTVAQEARRIARDARSTKDLSDAESECLRDLLQSDDAFALLVTAQQNAVLVDSDEHDVDAETAGLARGAAANAGHAIDRIVEDRIEEAETVVALADQLGDPATWGVVIDCYRAGYQSVAAVRNADLEELIADSGIHPEVAESIKATADEVPA